MSIESGGLATDLLEKPIKDEIKKEDEELEDGELDTDDEDDVPAVKQEQTVKDKSKTTNQTKSISQSSAAKSVNNKVDDKKKSNLSNNRKRRRRSGSEDSNESLNGKRNKRSSNYNRKNNRNKHNNASTDEDSGSDDEDNLKIDEKMMFTMLKKMQEIIMNKDKSSNKQNKQEYDKIIERFKNNKGGHKEMMKFFNRKDKMMNNSSQDMPALFNSTFNNPNMFLPNGPPNMFTGLQMNQMLGPPNNFPNAPFNPSLPHQFAGPGLLQTPQPPQNTIVQQQYAALSTLNDLARNQASLASQSSTNTSSSTNKKQKKRKKHHKEDKDESDDQVPKQLCKYFIEGHCQKGNDCDFIHSQPYNYKREVCKFYLQDSCGKGDNCTFLHKEFPCKLFHTGQDCKFGENCKFSHEPFNEELREIFVNYLDNAELNDELNQAYGLSKNVQKKPPILGDVPEDVKSSYQTWVWQQEMKKLEVAYTGTKRNLFCIDDQFVLKEEPPNDGYEDYSSFNQDIDERQNSFFIDTHGDMDEDDESQSSDQKLFTKDNDYRMLNDETNLENNEPELKSLDEVKKQWLNDESEEEDELEQSIDDNKEESPKKSTAIDISKMLDAIRQTSTQNNTNQVSTAATNSSDNNSEFWKSILNGVNLNDSKSDVDERSSSSQNSSLNQSKQPQMPNQPRDPRLLRQQRNQQNKKQQAYKIPADEPFVWSHGDVNFKLFKVDIDKIDYSAHKNFYELDGKLRNDPRLQNYFNNLNTQTNKQQQSNHTSSSTLNNNIISPTDVLAPLTLSESKNEPSNLTKLIIPPAPSSKLSALDLISPSSTKQAPPTSQLSFQEQILASVHLPKNKPLNISDHSGGLSSLADLVTEKSKKINS